MDVTASAVEEMQVGEENVQWAYRLIQLLDADTRLFLADGLLRKVEAFVATGEYIRKQTLFLWMEIKAWHTNESSDIGCSILN